MMPHPLPNFEIQKYYQNEANFHGVYSEIFLSEIKNGVYIISLDEYESIGIHWITLYGDADLELTYSKRN